MGLGDIHKHMPDGKDQVFDTSRTSTEVLALLDRNAKYLNELVIELKTLADRNDLLEEEVASLKDKLFFTSKDITALKSDVAQDSEKDIQTQKKLKEIDSELKDESFKIKMNRELEKISQRANLLDQKLAESPDQSKFTLELKELRTDLASKVNTHNMEHNRDHRTISKNLARLDEKVIEAERVAALAEALIIGLGTGETNLRDVFVQLLEKLDSDGVGGADFVLLLRKLLT
jgi:chromosome segregation ATPase